jgi:small GTP-binding protein
MGLGQQLKVHLWDTAGEEKFRSMLSLYYRDASAAIIVYDIMQSETYQNIQSWLNELNDKISKDGLKDANYHNRSEPCLGWKQV